LRVRPVRLGILYVSAVVIGIVAAISATVVAANAATTITVSGTVQCTNGKAVDGVWVQSTGGKSEFAGKTYLPNNYSETQYSATVLSGDIQVRVGCGSNTPTANWGSTNDSPWRELTGSRTLNVFCNGSGTCSWPATGDKVNRNLGDAGNCTWEALNIWDQYEGYYPLWYGNAYQWSASAAQYGWTVTSVPMSESIVVFPASNASALTVDGHVAWVNRVTVSGGNVILNITEMNYEGFNVVDTRNVTANSSLRYIVAPN